MLEIPACTKITVLTVKYGHTGCRVRIKIFKCGHQRIGSLRIDGIAGFGPIYNYSGYGSILFYVDRHYSSSFWF